MARLSARWQRSLAVGAAVAVALYIVEVAAGPGRVRSYAADLGLVAFALGAVVGAARAAFGSRGQDRSGWAWILAGALAWTVGQAFWAAADLGGRIPSTPSPMDAGLLVAAACWVAGPVLFLARHQQRLAVYALLLDVGAAVLTMLAGVALNLSEIFSTELIHDPFATVVALAYPVLYVAATGAALSMFWGLPPQLARRAHLSLLAGIGLLTIGAIYWLPDYIHDSFARGSVLDLAWMLGLLFVGIGGGQWADDPRGKAEPLLPASAVQFSRMLVPAIVAVLAATILIASQLDQQTVTDPIVAVAVSATIILLSIRAGLALYTNWRLGVRERRRAMQFATLYEVGLATAGEISLTDLARLAVDNVTRLTQTDGAMIALADEYEAGRYVIAAIDRSNMPQLRDSTGDALVGIGLECLRTREAAVATKYAAHPDSNPLLHEVIASALAFPLVAHGDLVGVMVLYSGRPRHWGSETQRIFRLYAAQVAVAVENARLLGESRRLASGDPLTGLTNRRVLVERLEAEAAEARRHGDAFCVILCDVDGLKAVNDSAGHLVGDSVLRSVAATLRATARAEDVVARFGGDEFVLLLPRTTLDAAQALVQRLARELPEQTYMWAGTPHALPRVSFGIAAFPDDGLLADQLIAKADERMYADKSRARGRVR